MKFALFIFISICYLAISCHSKGILHTRRSGNSENYSNRFWIDTINGLDNFCLIDSGYQKVNYFDHELLKKLYLNKYWNDTSALTINSLHYMCFTDTTNIETFYIFEFIDENKANNCFDVMSRLTMGDSYYEKPEKLYFINSNIIYYTTSQGENCSENLLLFLGTFFDYTNTKYCWDNDEFYDTLKGN